MRRLEYQDRALATVEAYLEALSGHEAQGQHVEALRLANPNVPIPLLDAPAAAWKELAAAAQLPPSRAGIPYSPRIDGVGRSVPNLTLKVPTGGGKTFLAVSAIAAAHARLLRRPAGMVLWIVPNDAIYRQTKRCLSDRQHPYRQVLDRMANGRVRILEKADTLRREDAEGALCVMLLMLASAARDQTTNLKLFQDRGDVHGFVPSEGDGPAHRALLDQVPNLDCYGGAGDLCPHVKDSMGNALRLLRPMVVLDEGHRGTTEIAHRALYGFNPRLVLELTATPRDVQPPNQPPRTANVLVDIAGIALHAEGMIKLPINLETRPDADWRATLAAAKARLDALVCDAERLRAETGRFIKPILLVQVERVTGESGVPGQVHADDARAWLLSAGMDAGEIAEKTSKVNDLAAPENQDLLHPANRIRAIITKAALQEGWDCPFAYVLCSLANVAANSALTQLVGRILRQPDAEPTGMASLDECYVVARFGAPAAVIQTIAEGLKRDGLGDVVQQVRLTAPDGGPAGARTIPRRPAFQGTPVLLPEVLWAAREAGGAGIARPLDYEMDILSALDWRGLDMSALVNAIPANARAAEGFSVRLELVGGEDVIGAASAVALAATATRIDLVHLVRMISDVVPNPWVAYDLAAALTAGLRGRGLDDAWQAARAELILDRLRSFLSAEQDRMAEACFRSRLAAGDIQFRLRVDELNWMLPERLRTPLPSGAPQLPRADGQPIKRSIFAPVYQDDFSSDPERHIAVYLDGENALRWWHRNAARAGYGLQGWRRHRVYPDFIVSRTRAGGDRIATIETKGDHLVGNDDTNYKRALFDLLSGAFAREQQTPAGTLQLVQANGTTVECRMVLIDSWQAELPALLTA